MTHSLQLVLVALFLVAKLVYAATTGPAVPGYTLSGDIDRTGVYQTVTRTHVVDQFNAIEQEITDIGSGTPPTQDFVYDASGNLVFDGLHWYRYDGWGQAVSGVPGGLADGGGLR